VPRGEHRGGRPCGHFSNRNPVPKSGQPKSRISGLECLRLRFQMADRPLGSALDIFCVRFAAPISIYDSPWQSGAAGRSDGHGPPPANKTAAGPSESKGLNLGYRTHTLGRIFLNRCTSSCTDRLLSLLRVGQTQARVAQLHVRRRCKRVGRPRGLTTLSRSRCSPGLPGVLPMSAFTTFWSPELSLWQSSVDAAASFVADQRYAPRAL